MAGPFQKYFDSMFSHPERFFGSFVDRISSEANQCCGFSLEFFDNMCECLGVDSTFTERHTDRQRVTIKATVQDTGDFMEG